MAIIEIGREKKKHDLTLLQAEHSEYLYKRENEIIDKLELEEPLTPEERTLFLMRVFQHLQETLQLVAENTERG